MVKCGCFVNWAIGNAKQFADMSKLLLVHPFTVYVYVKKPYTVRLLVVVIAVKLSYTFALYNNIVCFEVVHQLYHFQVKCCIPENPVPIVLFVVQFKTVATYSK